MILGRDFSGKMNLDAHYYRVPTIDYIDALNITSNAEGDHSDGPQSNLVGNRLVPYAAPAGNKTCIGKYEDSMRGLLYYFIYNDANAHEILRFRKSTRSLTRVMQTSALNFQKEYIVNDIYVIHRDDEGDLLVWNDRFNRPSCVNVDTYIASTYEIISDDMIRLAKKPPYVALLPGYDSDVNVKANNLKGKLFQFIFRWVYTDGFKSTWSPISKVKLPIDAYTVDIESDPTKNNVIYLQVQAGGIDTTKIEIAVRESNGDIWSDFFLVDTLNMEDYGITAGGSYNYKFLNDGAYPSVDPRETDLLFDYVPDKCNALTLVNGNTCLFAGITEGYDQIKRTDVNVQLTSSLVDTVASGNNPATPTITYTQGVSDSKYYTFFIIGTSVAEGAVYRIKFHGAVTAGDDFNVDVTYTAIAGDTPSSIAAAMVALIAFQLSGHPSIVEQGPDRTDKINVVNQQNKQIAHQYDQIVVSATAQILKSGGSPTWKWNTKYRFGLVYFDKYGKTNGVVSFVSNNEDPNDFSVTTPDFKVFFGAGDANKQPQIPVISASINHLPPSWATSYQWVRTPNLSTSSFLQYVTEEVLSDASYYYFGIQNLNQYALDNTGFVPSYEFKKGDRVRVLGAVADAPPHEYVSLQYGEDYEILGEVQKPVNGVAENLGRYLKVAKSPSAPAYEQLLLIEIYTPALRASERGQVFYEFGESYPIYTGAGGVRYHVGENQNQDAANPATFTFEDGDVYYKFRNFYTKTLDVADIYQVGIMDANYSDFYSSSVNSNGRPNVIDANAKRIYNPVLKRFGQSLQQGTDINGLNRVFPEDFDEDNRQFGDIMRMIPWNNAIISFQKHKIGAVPVLQQMTYNVDQTTNLILSSRLINKIQYYRGEYGIGDLPESLAWNNNSIYGWDNYRGVCWRLSQNGLTPISITAGFNSFAIKETSTRGFNSKIFGVFDSHNNLYISCMEANSSSEAKTIVWDERKDGLACRASYTPEMIGCINNLLVAWKDGALYTYDSDVFNNFFGVQYESTITMVFNEEASKKKTWDNISIVASSLWDSPLISTPILSGNLGVQESSLIPTDFEEKEGVYHAVFQKDKNSRGGVANGDPLKGQYLIVKLRNSASNFVILNSVEVGMTESSLNNKQ